MSFSLFYLLSLTVLHFFLTSRHSLHGSGVSVLLTAQGRAHLALLSVQWLPGCTRVKKGKQEERKKRRDNSECQELINLLNGKELSLFQLSAFLSSRIELTVIFHWADGGSLITAHTAARKYRKYPHSKAINSEKGTDDYKNDNKLGRKPNWKVSPQYADRNEPLLH